MTPQEKALELYTYHESLIRDFTRGVSIKELSKECALKCVDEILKCHMWKYNSVEPYKFWQQVKQEIEKI
jgi:hypothetical protein